MKKLFRKKKTTVLIFSLWGAFLLSLLLYANAVAPPTATTGGFGELTCAQSGCHVGTALNAGPGSVAITVPESYSSGENIGNYIQL